MKKTLSLFLALLMLLSVCPLTGAFGAHEHEGVLQSLRTESGLSTKFCGVFRCTTCGQTYQAPVTYKDVGMPIMNIEGSLDGISKDTKVLVKTSYSSADLSFDSFATLKIQGFTSIRYAKKNYSLQFVQESGSKNKVLINRDWGRQSKYCLKANWVDTTQARNIVSSRLFGEIVHSRGINDEVDPLLNGGAIDGFPILLYHNGDFLGLYTFNMPKDHWIFDMDDETIHQAVLGADWYTNPTSLWEPMQDTTDLESEENGFDLEYCSTEDTEEGTAWLGEAFNNFIIYLLSHDGQELRDTIGQYTDVDRCIDYMLYMFFIRADDNHAKNILWLSYDGTKFIPSAYDMDGTWGMKWNGEFEDISVTKVYRPEPRNNLYKKLLDNYSAEIKARYVELRQDVLSLSNIERQFNAFKATIPDLIYQAEANRWPDAPSRDVNTYARIMDFARAHVADLDAYFGVNIHEKGADAYRVAFLCRDGAKVSAYPTPDVSGNAAAAEAAYSVNEAGALTKNGGSVTFHVDAKKKTTVEVTVSPANGYTALEELGNGDYRLTGVSADLDVTVRLDKITETQEGYRVNFNCDSGLRVLVYPGQDLYVTPTETMSTVSVDADTGLPTKDGGQVNFRVVSDNPADVFSVTVTEGSYKNIKGFEDTGLAGAFRITKIKSDLTVRIAKDTTHAHDFTLRCTLVNGNDKQHRVYCACGQYTMADHHFTKQMLTDNAVYTKHEYKVCDDCGYSIKIEPCTHMCHNTSNPILKLIWPIVRFFYRLFHIHQYCECGEAHY